MVCACLCLFTSVPMLIFRSHDLVVSCMAVSGTDCRKQCAAEKKGKQSNARLVSYGKNRTRIEFAPENL